MKRLILSLDRSILRLLEGIAFITTVVLVVLVFLMVVTRYVFNWSIFGLDELALISAIWLYMCGAVISSRNATHIVVDFVPQTIKAPLLKKLYQRVIAGIIATTAGFFVYLAWDMLFFSLRFPQNTAALNISELVGKSAVMLASIGCFGYALRDLITGKACHNALPEG